MPATPNINIEDPRRLWVALRRDYSRAELASRPVLRRVAAEVNSALADLRAAVPPTNGHDAQAQIERRADPHRPTPRHYPQPSSVAGWARDARGRPGYDAAPASGDWRATLGALAR